jgi:hypothetical protein
LIDRLKLIAKLIEQAGQILFIKIKFGEVAVAAAISLGRSMTLAFAVASLRRDRRLGSASQRRASRRL